MKPLDFLIIGAQKCATTTLFEHLRSHPDIAMPLEKEVPFFSRQDCSEETWQDFAAEQFGDAQEHQLWAKTTPQYMSDPQVPARIKALMPDVKLVAILRDPIDRTLSHIQMGQRRDTEHRECAEAIAPLITEKGQQAGRLQPAPEHAEGYQSEAQFYVAWSEYGRILTAFSEHFEPQQLLVLYTEELEKDPEATLDRLLAFIGLPTGFRPPTLGEVIHRGGGSSKRIPQSVRAWLRDRRLLFWLWQLVPEARRGRLRFQYEQWNVSRNGKAMPLPVSLHAQLSEHYARDIQSLLGLPIAPPPWAESYLNQN